MWVLLGGWDVFGVGGFLVVWGFLFTGCLLDVSFVGSVLSFTALAITKLFFSSVRIS